jgi:type I restriction enzyme, S subunit
MSDQLIPMNWQLAKLGDISSDISYGYTASATIEPTGVKLLRITDIQNNTVNWPAVPNCTIDSEKIEKYRLKPGDLVFARTGATVGKSYLLKGEIPKSVYASYLIRVRCLDDISVEFLSRYFRSPYYWRQITDFSAGIGQPNVNGTKLKNLSISLPPLAEQKVIAEKLDTLLAQVESTKARLERIPKILKRFRQSVLAAAVSGKLTEEWRDVEAVSDVSGLVKRWADERDDLKLEKVLKKSCGPKCDPAPLMDNTPGNWMWVTFDHIAKHSNNALKAGPFGSALKKSDCVDEGFKVYGQEQVISSDESLVTYYVNDEKYEDLKACAIQPGDILVSLVGTIGKVLVLSSKAAPGIINPRLVKLSLQEEISRRFIQIFLESPVAHDFFRGFSHGGTMEILNLGILKELPIPLPPMEEQTEIVRRVDQLFAYADTIETQVNKALERVNNLTQSILAKAFRGELTEQWRKDNPDLISGENSADALLEKIKAERAAAKPVKRGRKTVKQA